MYTYIHTYTLLHLSGIERKHDNIKSTPSIKMNNTFTALLYFTGIKEKEYF